MVQATCFDAATGHQDAPLIEVNALRAQPPNA
jgi:hypothetical protein